MTTEFSIDRDPNTIYSNTDYEIQECGKKLKLVGAEDYVYKNDQYKYGLSFDNIELIDKQIGSDCGLASIINLALLAGMDRNQIAKKITDLCKINGIEIESTIESPGGVEKMLLDYCIERKLCTIAGEKQANGTIVRRLGFNPTSRNLDIKAKLEEVA